LINPKYEHRRARIKGGTFFFTTNNHKIIFPSTKRGVALATGCVIVALRLAFRYFGLTATYGLIMSGKNGMKKDGQGRIKATQS
jgi:hypothetical protein